MKNFELTNDQRKYLGLEPVGEDWIRKELNDTLGIYVAGGVIRKVIRSDGKKYTEDEVCIGVDLENNLILPKTHKGKPRKMTPSVVDNLRGNGMYFSCMESCIVIANYVAQRTYSSCRVENAFLTLQEWLDEWIAGTTERDLEDLENFKRAKRKHCTYREGDFFRFKIGRRKWGYGRILMDIAGFRKSEKYNWNDYPWFDSILGVPLLVKVYYVVSDSPDEPIENLSHLKAFPSQLIMDNRFYYGEYEIIGHKDLTPDESDMPISLSIGKSGKVGLQYGLITRRARLADFKWCLALDLDESYAMSGIGFNLDVEDYPEIILSCIEEQSNRPYWEEHPYYKLKYDLRNPKNQKLKEEIFRYFALDANASYAELLEKEEQKKGRLSFFKLFL